MNHTLIVANTILLIYNKGYFYRLIHRDKENIRHKNGKSILLINESLQTLNRLSLYVKISRSIFYFPFFIVTILNYLLQKARHSYMVIKLCMILKNGSASSLKNDARLSVLSIKTSFLIRKTALFTSVIVLQVFLYKCSLITNKIWAYQSCELILMNDTIVLQINICFKFD